jgi:hypothetical protein
MKAWFLFVLDSIKKKFWYCKLFIFITLFAPLNRKDKIHRLNMGFDV